MNLAECQKNYFAYVKHTYYTYITNLLFIMIYGGIFLDSKLKEFAGMESEIELISVYLMYN